MSTHNIYFCGEIRKILCGYPLLSVAMNYCLNIYASIIVFLRGVVAGMTRGLDSQKQSQPSGI